MSVCRTARQPSALAPISICLPALQRVDWPSPGAPGSASALLPAPAPACRLAVAMHLLGCASRACSLRQQAPRVQVRGCQRASRPPAACLSPRGPWALLACCTLLRGLQLVELLSLAFLCRFQRSGGRRRRRGWRSHTSGHPSSRVLAARARSKSDAADDSNNPELASDAPGQQRRRR